MVKLYIAGGGWTRLRSGRPLDCAVAISLAVPWDRTSQKHKLSVDLSDEDGVLVQAPDGNEVRIEGQLEVGRPPGTKPGEPIYVHVKV